MNKILFFSLFCVLLSCKQKNNNNAEFEPVVELDKQTLIDVNKHWIKDESFLIDQFCARHQMDVVSTASGVRYFIYDSTDGEKVEPGDQVTISFEVRLLDADTTLCYKSDSLSPYSFIVEMDNIESGLHEAITFFNKAEKGYVVLPHYLAHGLIGNMDKIPPLSPVLYNIHLLDVVKN